MPNRAGVKEANERMGQIKPRGRIQAERVQGCIVKVKSVDGRDRAAISGPSKRLDTSAGRPDKCCLGISSALGGRSVGRSVDVDGVEIGQTSKEKRDPRSRTAGCELYILTPRSHTLRRPAE